MKSEDNASPVNSHDHVPWNDALRVLAGIIAEKHLSECAKLPDEKKSHTPREYSKEHGGNLE